MVRLMNNDIVGTNVIDLCEYGLRGSDLDGDGPVQKSTRVMSNSPEILKRLSKRCRNRDPQISDKDKHKHVVLVCGKAKAAQVYPKSFGEAICE